MTNKSTADTNTTRAWVDIDLGALLRNGEALAKHARVPLLPMVKADGYGLGAMGLQPGRLELVRRGFGDHLAPRERRADQLRRGRQFLEESWRLRWRFDAELNLRLLE